MMSRGYKHSEEAKQKIRAARLGMKFTEEHRARISAAKKMQWADPVVGKRLLAGTLRARRENPAWNKGKKMDEAWSSRQRRKVVSEETRAKARAAALAQWENNPELREAKSRALRQRWVEGDVELSPRAGWGHGARYRGVWMRSDWERLVAAWLDLHGIEWQYEPRRFNLGTCSYRPDFYLPDFGIWWEVKGSLGTKALAKIRLFRQCHDEPLVIIDKGMMRFLGLI